MGQCIGSNFILFDTITTRKLSNDLESYPMTYPRRGNCIVINNENFAPGRGLPNRPGSQSDVDRLQTTFGRLGFNVKVHKDLTSDEMIKIMNEQGGDDHTDADCLALVFLSHGKSGNRVCGSDGHSVVIDELVKPLKMSTTLIGKPKLIFIQACRGNSMDDGVDSIPGSVEGLNKLSDKGLEGGCELPFDEVDSSYSHHKLPIEADQLVAYSTVAGYLAYKKREGGSYFIQALCDMLDKFADRYDLPNILIMVNREVATKCRINYRQMLGDGCKKHEDKKQMPSMVFQLTKQLYLSPKVETFKIQLNVFGLRNGKRSRPILA